MQPPLHNLFRNAWLINNTWLDEQGNELGLPPTMMGDQNWTSQRAQDFWHDINAARSHQVPMDDLWGYSSDDDDSSSESDEPDIMGCEMPGLVSSESESNDFAPYASKTVSGSLSLNNENS
jgi:hypothetical protein